MYQGMIFAIVLVVQVSHSQTGRKRGNLTDRMAIDELVRLPYC